MTDALNTGVAGRLPWAEFARRVEGLEGSVQFRAAVRPGTSLGTVSPWVSETTHGPVLRVDGLTLAVRTLGEQVELESRTRLLNPKWYEAQLAAGYEGARNVAGHVTTTLGWSATGGARAVPGWVYAEVGETFVLDDAMRARLAALNPTAAATIAERLLEANDRGYWAPDAATLDALRDAAAELEDRMEGVGA